MEEKGKETINFLNYTLRRRTDVTIQVDFAFFR